MSIAEAEALRGAPLILAIKNGDEARLAPPADQMIWVGSVLGVLGKREAVERLRESEFTARADRDCAISATCSIRPAPAFPRR